MTTNNKKNEIVPITESIPALAGDTEALALAFAENLGGEKISVFDLERIKIPSGGGPTYTIIDPDGTEDSIKEMVGTIVWVESRKSYWADNQPDGSPPDCRSEDCQTGMGHWNPDDPDAFVPRECKSCPMNEFGTAVKDDGSLGKGKACKDTRLVFFMRQGSESMLPSLVILPPTSIKPLQRYLVSLASKGVAITAALSKLALKKENSDGTDYSVVRPSLERRLTGEETQTLRDYAKGIKVAFATMDTSEVEQGAVE